MTNPALPEFLEPYRLADQSARLEGTMPGAWLQRIAQVADLPGEVRVSAEFGRSDDQYRTVSGRVICDLEVACERCLQSMVWPVDAEFTLVLVPAPTQLQSVPKTLDPWLVEPGVEVPMAELVEDTVLLALPAFPTHDPAQCRIQTEFTPPEAEQEPAAPEADDTNPFSVLARIRPDQSNQE